MTEVLFWIFLALIFYTYVGYGIVLYFLSIIASRPVLKNKFTPSVSIIIAAYNEEAAIASKIKNALSLDYPASHMEIIVGSDASSDNTDKIVNEFADQRVRLIRVEGRQGKTAVQNECASKAKSEILIFTDATTHLHNNSVAELVNNFSDDSVGCVGAKLIYRDRNDSQVGHGGTSYWSYETFIKRNESAINSLIGVSGCFYAIRKSLYEPIPSRLISDFVIALNTYKQGYRIVFEENAICDEETLTDVDDEMRMRARVALRTYTALAEKRELLNPFKYPLYAFQLISHKILRYSVGIFMIGAFTTNLFILSHVIYKVALAGQLIFYSIAFFAHIQHKKSKKKSILSIPYYLILVNLASLNALWRFLKGDKVITWEPKR